MARPTIEGRYNLSLPEEQQRMHRDLARCREGIYEVEAKPVRNLRSNAQNRYFHGVLCKLLADFLNEQDYEVHDVDEAHRILAAKFLLKAVVKPDTGEIISRYVRSTASLNTLEFTQFIDRSRAWMQDFFNIYTPDPGEYGIDAAPVPNGSSVA